MSNALVEQLHRWMKDQEGERLEFKEAKTRFSKDELARYSCALANEGGGRIILGVTNKRPRKVVGTQAFVQTEEIRRWLMGRVPLRIEVDEITDPSGRVLIFEVPPRPIGVPIKCDGIYWARKADGLEPLSEDALRRIFAESGHDFSSDVCAAATQDDLDPQAIEDFRSRWIRKSGNEALAAAGREQLLRDAEVLVEGGITFAALVLFGTRQALGRLLGRAEVIFEYRSSDESGPAQERREYRQGFFAFYDDLWSAVAQRNDLQHYHEGLFVYDIPTLDERSVREAILNAVAHRNYQLGGNVFVRQYPRKLVVDSPGGLPVGITLENMLDRQSPRNRRIADVLGKCGLVERSGQGMNLMFERSIQQGKLRPDLSGTDTYNVVLTLHGEVADPRFVQFLERVARETTASFDTRDFLTLDLVHRERPVPEDLRSRLLRLRELGVIETVGRGAGTRYLLNRRFYTAIGRRGVYTRRRGLDREQNKALLLRHLRDCGSPGCAISELEQVLPALSRGQLKGLLGELRSERVVRLVGVRRWAKWVAIESGLNI